MSHTWLIGSNYHTGITKVSADLQSQLVSVEGTAAPSAIVAAIEATGRDAILRGSGKSDSKAEIPWSRANVTWLLN